MNDSVQDTPQETASSNNGPGHQLRAAREAQGIERFRIAEHLHLRVELIKALENDDYDRLPGPVFVRGYIRNYARALNLAEGPLLQSFDRIRPKEEPIGSSAPSPSHPKLTHHNQLIIRLITWGIIIFFAIMLVIWIRGQVDWSSITLPGEEGENLPAEELPLQQDEVESGLLPTLDSVSDGTKHQAAPGPGGALAKTKVPLSSRRTEASRKKDKSSAVAEKPLSGVGTSDDGTNRQSPPKPATPIDKAQADKAGSAQALSPPAGTVTLEFSGPCWVDIRSEDGKKVLVGELNAGARRVLRGEPPFKILLGNAPAVTITIDGQEFDLRRHTRGRVARLTLDPRKKEAR
ncbi:MAG TPA: helix-turn-helix domain-containing protein [Chromatiales bacterium]|nr:helix-turn-helix domain-containing protein [Chromatiales bacterium]